MRTLSSELAPHVARLVERPRVYADANVPARVVAWMRQRLAWDVYFVLEHAELRRASDVEHYRLARQLHRTLVTLDRDYFDDRHFPPEASAGVIVLSAPDERGLLEELERVDRHVLRKHETGGQPAALPLVGQKLLVQPDWRPMMD